MDSVDLNDLMARLSHAEQIRLLVSHPFFSGRCPHCRSRIPLSQAKLGQSHCGHCGWEDLEVRRYQANQTTTA